MPVAWLLDNSCIDVRQDNHFDPPKFLTLEEVKDATGLECFQVNVDDMENDKDFLQLRKERDIESEVEVELSEEKMPKDLFDANLGMLYTEHNHQTPEVRLFLDGSGYLDVRNKEDEWIRVHAEKNDLLILPAGVYHRFTLDSKSSVKIMRLSRNKEWSGVCRHRDLKPSKRAFLLSIINRYGIFANELM